MKHVLPWLKQYWGLTASISVTIVCGVLFFGFGQTKAADLLTLIFCGIMAAFLTAGIVKTLREGSMGVDVLAVMAIISTLAVGEYWASLIIVLMMTSGEALENYAESRARSELTALLSHAPQIAHKITGDTVTDVPVSTVAVGDLLQVKPGDVVPVDSVIVTGQSAFDESSLTGESLPVEKSVNDHLLSGSLNGNSVVTVRALSTAHDSQYEQIIELVKAASGSKSHMVRLADRYAVPFTGISLFIAGTAWAVSGDPLRLAEVLVVATPCPLLLGAPIALISGMSRAAKHGIIMKNGSALEALARVRTVAFDKTGTLTLGKPTLHKIHPEPGYTQHQLLQYSASLEQHSGHVLANALVEAARERHIELLEAASLREDTGTGMYAVIDGQSVFVGKFAALAVLNIKPVSAAPDHTAVAVAIDGKFAGSIEFADEARANTPATLKYLNRLGISHTLMLTGDNEFTAKRIGANLGIADVRANCLPADKLAAINSLSAQFLPVAMVGDGVNDAPVLAAASVGIAMGAKGSTAASESADVVIMLDDIAKVAHAIDISRRTIHIALQSILIGIAISIGLMLLASTGVIPAPVGAGLQEIVDVIVIINALRAHRGTLATVN